MPTLHNISHKVIIKFLKDFGFLLKRIKGSHHIFYHPSTKQITVVPVHNKTLPIGTTLSIIKQAGHTSQDFLSYLQK